MVILSRLRVVTQTTSLDTPRIMTETQLVQLLGKVLSFEAVQASDVQLVKAMWVEAYWMLINLSSSDESSDECCRALVGLEPQAEANEAG